ncbi:hypothetical protein [Enterococcus mundtii]|uniref:WxL domain-containing protein n=1 Tax=Enterococcus mundtii TaxID=53346 RepID=A0A2S7RZ18_ENTMU|nr:hypothetical protein [Enterococcus mundtii]MDA9461767.1 hypothetical protein [Enterococcus mundtii 3F]PQF25469.1 hypothetical protein CUS89_01520 [Enterococcus mundtii]
MKKVNLVASLMVGACLTTSLINSFEVMAASNENNINNNGDGDNKTDGKIAVEGTLGPDNTNPDIEEPGEKDDLINVTIPIKIAYWTVEDTEDVTNNHNSIVSSEHTITNNSSNPVKIDVSNFEFESDPESQSRPEKNFASLGIMATYEKGKEVNEDEGEEEGNEQVKADINLVSAGVLQNVKGKAFMVLAYRDASANSQWYQGSHIGTFSFNGEVSQSEEIEEKIFNRASIPTVIKSDLQLSFTALEKNGQEY